MIVQMVQRLVARLEALKGSNTVIRIDYAMAALSRDVMRRICCDDGEYFLDNPNFAPWWYITPS